MSIHQIEKTYDIVVVGGGISGLCAAVAAARHGAKTAIVQNRPMFGGNASSEIRMHILGAGCHMAKFNQNETGLILEILLNNKHRNPTQAFSVWDTVLWEKARYQKNLDCYLNANVDDLIIESGAIKTVICHQLTTETKYSLNADIFIDATGHGTVGVMAGAESRMGSEGRDEFNEPNAPDSPNDITGGNSILFHAVDRGKPVKFIKPFWAYDFSEEDLKYRRHDEGKASFANGGSYTEYQEGESDTLPELSNMDAGYWWIELGGQHKDIITEAEDIRDELLRCVYGVWNHIKNVSDHGAANYDLDWVGIVPGYRESRRLVGDYLLTENDVRSNQIFDDAVAYGGWPMDEHTPGGIMDFDKYPSRIFNFAGVYTIPFRCFYSRNIPNLMMAGRDISVSKMAYGTTRVMATCAVGGQASGTAAALAIQKKITPREVGRYINTLQQALIRDDCYIPGFVNEDEQDMARKAVVSADGFKPGCEPEKVINGIGRRILKEENCWESTTLGQTLRLHLGKIRTVSEVRLVFDPDLSREIMPTISGVLLARQPEWLPPQLVKAYTLRCLRDGETVYEKIVEENCQRLNVVSLSENIVADSVELCVTETYGSETARVFEVKIY